MLLSFHFTASVSGVNRWPAHVSQCTVTSGRKLISILFRPWPSHSGQRPSATLNENRLGPYPRILASGTLANSRRMSSQNPTYVAGHERGVLPIGVWSTSNVRSTCSPPGSFAPPFKPRYNTSRTSVLLPLPLTPVTQTNWQSGIFTRRFFKLCSVAPTISIDEVRRRDAALPSNGCFNGSRNSCPVTD